MTIIGLAAAAALVVVPLAASLLVGSLDSRDADRAELAFATADCGEVAARAEQIDGRMRPPWIDPPSLATFERGCAELTTALDGSAAEVVQALAELRTTTRFPAIETAANSRLKSLLASSDVVGNDGRLLCERVGDLWDNRLITADDGPFALLRACGLALARDGDTGAELLRRAVQAARSSELDTLTEPEVVQVWVDAPATCGWLAEVSSLLGAAAPGKYASCGRAQLDTGRADAGVNTFGDLVRLYPDSPEAQALPDALQTEPAICSPLAGLDALPFTSSPDWFAGHKLTCGTTSLDARRWLEAEQHLNEAVATGAETEAVAEATALLEAMRPASGTLLGESTINRTGSIGLEVVNKRPFDVVVAVLYDDGRSLRFYVRSGEQAEIRSFPVGSYKVLVVTGDQWLPEPQEFANVLAVGEIDDRFDIPAGYVGKDVLTLGGDDPADGEPVESLPPLCEDLRAAGLAPSFNCI